MILLENLSRQEQMELLKGRKWDGHYVADKLKETLEFLSGNMRAYNHAWTIAQGNYYINTPAEIAEYCIQWAKSDEK